MVPFTVLLSPLMPNHSACNIAGSAVSTAL